MFLYLLISFITAANGIVNDPDGFIAERRPESDYFLPDNILARSYELLITPHFTNEAETPWFEGELNMTFTPVIPGTSYVTLNAGEGLNINESSVQIVSSDGDVIFLSVTPVDREVQMFSIIADQELIPLIDYTLTISFQGIITNAGFGLYRGSYVEPDNVKRWYLGTQLRPVFARQLFPCLDEPKYKAVFSLTVVHPQEFLARSNQPHIMVSVPDENGRRQTTFAETPLMSAYLLTLFVFQFISVNSDTGSSFIHPRFKGWAVPSKINQMEFSQDICPKLVNIAENYFGSALPVPKMDQIALPDLVVIAMENWGINTYREINILADRTSPMRQRQTVGRFTGHEVLHHWIGDLVTLEWWDYLWIHEVFAMYFEYFFPNQMTPSWRMMDQFINDLTVEGLHGDNINSPLTTRVVTPQEITSKFMGLTYTKGPAIIRMLEHAVGREILQKALSDLVDRKKYSTMTPQDLWTSFQPYTRINVNRMMSTWTDQGSYPILFVYRDTLTNTINIEQNSSDNYGGNTSQLWNIPITYTTKSERNFENTSPIEIMTRPILRLKPNNILSEDDWIILNLKFTGYYRILYENDIIHLIVKQLLENHTEIHRLNRAQLIDDIFDFADKKITNYQLAFYLVSYLYKEREYVPLRVAFRAFREIDAKLQLTPIYDKFQTYMKLLLKLIYNDIGFDDKSFEQPLDKLNREQVVEWACYYDVEDCRVRSSVLFEKTIRDGLATSSLPADTRSTIMCYAAKYGSLDSQNYFINEINRLTADKTTVEMNSLACSPSDSLVYILNSQIPDHKWIDMFTAIIAREENSLFAVTYLTMNLDNIVARVGEDTAVSFIKQLQAKKSLQGISKNLAQNLQNSKSYRNPNIMSALNDLLSIMRTNELWIKEHYKDIEDSLDQFTNTMRVAKYFMFRPINFFDSFRLTKALHSHLYSGL